MVYWGFWLLGELLKGEKQENLDFCMSDAPLSHYERGFYSSHNVTYCIFITLFIKMSVLLWMKVKDSVVLR